MPYFPYSRQSKKKAHRGAIVARMVANLMKVAGVDHVVTIDLHATQMQGFFKCPIDNLTAEPLLTRWVRQNIKNWEDSVVVSKNPGGTKRATSLADKLNLSFGIVTTDQRKPKYPPSMMNSMVLDGLNIDSSHETLEEGDVENRNHNSDAPRQHDWAHNPRLQGHQVNGNGRYAQHSNLPNRHRGITSNPAPAVRRVYTNGDAQPSPLAQETRPPSSHGAQQAGEQAPPVPGIPRAITVPSVSNPHHVESDGYEEPEDPDNDSDEAPRDVITGRLIHGHIVDDDVPSPTASQYSTARNHRGDRKGSSDDEEPPEHMLQSFTSVASSQWGAGMHDGGLGGTMDANHSDEEEEDNFHNPEIETRVTLVGNVRDKPVIIVDDMIDKAGSWIAAAETVVKRGAATKVYCMATHGLFGGNSLEQLDQCDEIEAVIVTNSFPISDEKRRSTRKLIVLDVSNLLSEAIRRNHHGESISGLYYLMD